MIAPTAEGGGSCFVVGILVPATHRAGAVPSSAGFVPGAGDVAVVQVRRFAVQAFVAVYRVIAGVRDIAVVGRALIGAVGMAVLVAVGVGVMSVLVVSAVV